MEFMGLMLFEDPVRLEVKEAFQKTKKAGIDLKVITGDYQNTAEVVLEKLEIAGSKLKDEEMMSGEELAGISQGELKRRIKDIILFYRTTPEQKIRIVEALQSLDHIVAMMGDGVNDSLALKKADIGVVVGEASEVSKETADMVLLDSNFQTIIAAIEEGRGIFNNLRKVVLYLLSDSFTGVLLIGGSLILGLPVPVLPAQILWINLVEDSLPGLALAFEPKEEGLMQEKPRKKDDPIIDEEVKNIILIVGGITSIMLFAVFYYFMAQNLIIEKVRSLMFASFAIDSILYLFSCKTLKKNLWEDKFWDNKFLVASAVISFGLLLIGIYVPFFNYLLGTVPFEFYYWFLIFAIGIVGVTGIELIKWVFKTKSRRA
jgi:Ca2+-transporting ATPase